MSQLADLSIPFTRDLIQTKPGQGGGSYVEHNSYVERVLLHCGPYRWELVEILRSEFDHKIKGHGGAPDSFESRVGVVAVVMRLTLRVDGYEAVYEEVGDVEHPDNWKTDGARLKDAMSDAFKRCCMRAGLGLHLWSQDAYFLRSKLREREQASGSPEGGQSEPSSAPTVDAEDGVAGVKPAAPTKKAATK